MLKRLLMIAALCIGLMAVWSTDSNALISSGTGWAVLNKCVEIDSNWVGIKNTDISPSYLQASIVLYQIIVYYQNPGGNTGGIGVPFDLPLDIKGTDQVNPEEVSARGNYDSKITFTDEMLIKRIEDLYPGLLEANKPNPNSNSDWIPVSVDVVTMDVYIQAFYDMPKEYICPTNATSDPSGYNNDLIPYNDTCYINYNADGTILNVRSEEEVVHIKGFCTITGGVGTKYDCIEDVHWEWKNNDMSYPYGY
jgi:hypothetical protein